MSQSIMYRRGNLEDLSTMRFANGIAISAESIEYNVAGMGHEFWIAFKGDTIIALSVLGRVSPSEIRIIYLQVADSYRRQGVGSSLLRALIDSNPAWEVSVIPFHGTEEFYHRLGFEQAGHLEMRRRPSGIRTSV